MRKLKEELDYLKVLWGEYYADPILDKDYLSYFNKIDTKKSYLVVSYNFSKLQRFVRFYLLKDPSKDFITYDVNEYVDSFVSKEVIFKELLIISYPMNAFEMGKTGDFIREALLQTVSSRNRIGYQTIILAEKGLDYFNNSGELKIVTLDNIVANRNNTTVPTSTVVVNQNTDTGTSAEMSWV